MAYISKYARRKLTGHLTGRAWTPPVATYLGLFNNIPGDVTPGVLITNAGLKKVTWETTLNETRLNTNAVIFGPATAEWGQIQSVGIFDSLAGAANLLWAERVIFTSVGIGDSYQIAAGQLEFAIAAGVT